MISMTEHELEDQKDIFLGKVGEISNSGSPKLVSLGLYKTPVRTLPMSMMNT